MITQVSYLNYVVLWDSNSELGCFYMSFLWP